MNLDKTDLREFKIWRDTCSAGLQHGRTKKWRTTCLAGPQRVREGTPRTAPALERGWEVEARPHRPVPRQH